MTQDGIIRGETGAQRLIGYELDVGQADKRARCHLTLTDAHMNRHGVMHGGIAVAVLDNALGATASLTVDPTGRAPFLTISLTTQFIAPAPAGTELTATGRITGGGKSTLFAEADLRAADGTLIATAVGVFKRVPPERLGN
ncbi:PaaI family thioesterase [Yoonia sediminilitoris]|uniref:Uncharacterized protein (TIGR00369 family) n=1 Tax=Yoonia sediminilitoris TaxID=1286148 RepID=A0A2T6KR10_9RHOB|nr:PaaI family thioesterase [Yoonia sediminilitoris]PUB18993.1 uncharacterized protein (TIGR00369 family) [Yoonia sediminilitoris]RCW99161.1 uncharacterized protein (TIGR00369 family) [Yoonia sediminilitoris]